MPVSELIGWNKTQRRWYKRYPGKLYFISPREVTKDASREAANDWWTICPQETAVEGTHLRGDFLLVAAHDAVRSTPRGCRAVPERGRAMTRRKSKPPEKRSITVRRKQVSETRWTWSSRAPTLKAALDAALKANAGDLGWQLYDYD